MRSLRRETLRATLARVQGEYRDVYFPIARDYGAMPRIIRVCSDEGAVFRSKARVPILICFEVIRPVLEGDTGGRKRRTSSLDYMSEEEVRSRSKSLSRVRLIWRETRSLLRIRRHYAFWMTVVRRLGR
jgi:hypothetical protein